ncbi:LysR family transcriptional regulator [Gordonia hankookensis]|uniref:LysR family transcriptional regulator n=1 Tax=Gordonia hankookensis TaxID=589403 RepID=A0ABR7WI19_9ACTN|nr:LysR family transcriptional regulator [Gordonia hankookensis]MBD1322413.1 LysR family transcriptional regulator [Gordonia hankookensis]
MVDPHRLRVFRAVVAEGSIGGAARALGYTSSAVSQHISALQRETGLALVERDGRGVLPTQDGLILAEESAAVFDHLARLDGIVGDLRQGRAGRLSVSYFASAGTTWIPPIVATITREFPDIRLDLRLVELAEDSPPGPDVEVYVDGAASSTLGGYECEHLVTEPYYAVVHSDSPLAAAGRVTLGELATRSWVDNDIARGPCRQALLDACTAIGFTPDFGVQTQDYPTAIRFVAAGVGLTVVPELALVGLPDEVVALPIEDPTPTRAIWMRRHHRVAGSQAADRVVGLLRSAV